MNAGSLAKAALRTEPRALMSDDLIPTDPRTKLTRKQLAAALTPAGFETAPQTLGRGDDLRNGDSQRGANRIQR